MLKDVVRTMDMVMRGNLKAISRSPICNAKLTESHATVYTFVSFLTDSYNQLTPQHPLLV